MIYLGNDWPNWPNGISPFDSADVLSEALGSRVVIHRLFKFSRNEGASIARIADQGRVFRTIGIDCPT